MSMVNAALNCLQEMKMAVVFDTTASNSGKWQGSVTLFEQKIERALLWLACHHHVSELCIKHVHETV